MSERKKRLIPFSWTPASWGLRGPQRDEAEAAYYYDGYELDIRIAEIRNADDQQALAKASARIDHKHGKITDLELTLRMIDLDETIKDDTQRKQARLDARLDHGDIDAYEHAQRSLDLEGLKGDALKLARLEIDFKHGKLTALEHDTKAVEIEHPEEGTERELAMLEVKRHHHEISELQYEKEKATLMEEPWVGIVDQGFEPEKGLNGVYFKFDWNDYWISYLRLNGYYGQTEDQIVEAWFGDVCRAQSLAPARPDIGTVIPFSGRVVNKTED